MATASLFELLGSVNWGDLEGYNAVESGLFEYSNSKLMTIMAMREMNRRLKVRISSSQGQSDKAASNYPVH